MPENPSGSRGQLSLALAAGAAPATRGPDPAGAMDRVERKSILYRSGLGFHCVNHVQGCSHGCRYPCYAFMMARHHGRASDYEAWCRPRLVGNALALLERDLHSAKFRSVDTVHLSLTTDPFMVGYSEVEAMTLSIMELLNRRSIGCSILTKGLLPIELADRSRFGPNNTFGVSLVSLDEGFRLRWEPGAAPYVDRIAAMRRLHEAGCLTRVHMEPYPTPDILEQDLMAILEAVSFVDHVYWGGWNYNPRACAPASAEAFYNAQAPLVRQFCQDRGIECEIGPGPSPRKKPPVR